MALRLENLVKRFCVMDVIPRANPTEYVLNGFNIEEKSYKSRLIVSGKKLHTGDFLRVQFMQESALKHVDAKTLVDAFPIKYITVYTHGPMEVYPKITSAQQHVVEVYGNTNIQALQIFWELNAEELELMQKLKGRRLYAIVSASCKISAS